MAEKEKKEKKTPSQNAPQDGVFTLEGVRFLVELMKENNVSELDWKQGDARLKLRRGAVAPVVDAKRAAASDETSNPKRRSGETSPARRNPEASAVAI